MNCTECQENWVALTEGLLNRDDSLECLAHLKTCAWCLAEYQALLSLQQRLMAWGQAAVEAARNGSSSGLFRNTKGRDGYEHVTRIGINSPITGL